MREHREHREHREQEALKHRRDETEAGSCSFFTFHSFRIGFACALLEAGCSYDMIQALARWKSNQSIVIYARLEPHAYADWVDKAMLQSTSSTTARDLPTINDDVRVASFAQAAAHFEREGAATIEDT